MKNKRNLQAMMSTPSPRKRAKISKRRFALAAAIAAMSTPYGFAAAGAMLTPAKSRISTITTADGKPEQLAVLTAVIVTNTTTATKTAGCGILSFNGRSSVLGVGVAVEHTPSWKITSAPAGFTYTCTDPRPGATSGATIDLANGGWYGWTLALPIGLVAGDYTIELTIADADGNTHATSTTVTVAAFAGETRYLDSTAVGANDGTSAADAYTNIDTALVWVLGGTDRRLSMAGSQTYTIASWPNRDQFISNNRIYWDSVGTKPVWDVGANSAFRFGRFGTNLVLSENLTIEGIVFYTDAPELNDDIPSQGHGPTNIILSMSDDIVSDFCIRDCAFSQSGTRLKSFVITEELAANRSLLFNNDTSRGARHITLMHGGGDCHAVGNITGPCGYESTFSPTGQLGSRPVRYTGGGSFTSLYNVYRTGYKDCIRLQEGTHHTIYGCDIEIFDDGLQASNCIILGLDSGQPFHTTIANNNIRVTSNQARPMSCIASSVGPTLTDMDLMVRGNVIESSGSSPDGSSAVGATFMDLVFVINNTITTSTNSSGAACLWVYAISGGRVESNILIYDGPALASVFNDRLINVNFLVGGSFLDNDISIGLANTNSDMHYRIGGVNMTLATLNGLSYASGNTEVAITLDSDHMPSPLNAATNPQGIRHDYYDNAMVPGVVGSRGAVQSVPLPPGNLEGTSRSRLRTRER